MFFIRNRQIFIPCLRFHQIKIRQTNQHARIISHKSIIVTHIRNFGIRTFLQPITGQILRNRVGNGSLPRTKTLSPISLYQYIFFTELIITTVCCNMCIEPRFSFQMQFQYFLVHSHHILISLIVFHTHRITFFILPPLLILFYR